MATVTATSGDLQMADPINFSGLLNSVANGVGTATFFSTINMGFGGGVWQFTGAGFGGYVAGIPSTGTLTAVTYFGTSTVTVTGLSLSIATLFTFVDNQDQNGLYNFVFAGNDTITGTSFSESLTGYGGANVINGNDGDDLITTLGIDTIDGGAGRDMIAISRSQTTSATILDLTGIASDTGITLANGTSIRNVESFDVTLGSGNDTFLYSGDLSGFSILKAGAGFDRLVLNFSGSAIAYRTTAIGIEDVALLGRSLVVHDAEVFEIAGGEAADEFFGGANDDVLSGGGGNDSLRGGSGADTLSGGLGDDVLEGGSGVNALLGAEGDDRIVSGVIDGSGGTSVDLVDGGAGSDLLMLVRNEAAADLILSTSAMRTSEGAQLGDGTVIRNVERVSQVSFGAGADNLIVDGNFVGGVFYGGGGGVDRLTANLATHGQAISLSQQLSG